MAEGQRLQRIGRTAKDPVKLRRSIVVLMSAQGQPAAEIAHLMRQAVRPLLTNLLTGSPATYKTDDPSGDATERRGRGQEH
jgi:hypothetical protein